MIIAADIVGDLAMLPGGIVDGWCWSPSRPQQRLRVDLLIEGAVAAQVNAGVFRRDLLLLQIGDGRHGFRLPLPRGALHAGRTSCLIEAREPDCGQTFGRWLHEPPDAPPPRHAGLDAMSDALAALAARLARLEQPPASLATALRRAWGELATVLEVGVPPTAGVAGGGGVAAARAVLAERGAATLPRMDDPDFTLALCAGAGTAAGTLLARLRALAPVASRLAAEVVLVDPGHDCRLALLPSMVANLRHASSLGDAVGQARGGYLALLDADASDASAAALGDLLAQPGVRGCLLLDRGQAVEAWPVAAPVGVTLAGPINLFRDGLEEASETLRRARAAGLPCRVPTPPWSPSAWLPA